MKKRFYLVRHGEKVKIIGDPPLSGKGVKEAKQTGEFFKSLNITKIITSPIKRSKETAEYIAKALGFDIEVNDLLKERVNWGDDPKQSFEDFIEMWERASNERTWKPPVGDSSVISGKRMEKVIQSLLSNNNEHTILVTHGGIICDYLKNVFQSEVLKHFPNDDLIFDDVIPECSITTVEYEDDNKSFSLVDIASADHLKNL